MFYTPLGFTSGDAYRSHDWQIAATHDALFRDAVLEHGQFPLRSHLVGGGYPVIGHPSDGSLSPMILPSLLLGERLGLKVNLVMAMVLGALGVFLLARNVVGIGGLGPLLAALGFVVAGWHPSRVLVGYYESTFYLFFPMMLYLLLTAGRSPGRLVLAAALTATCFMQVLGGAVAFLLYAGVHLLYGFRGEVFTQTRRRGWTLAVAVMVLAAGLGAVKFVPMLHLLGSGTNDRMDPHLLAQMPASAVDRFAYTRSYYFYSEYRSLAAKGHLDFFYDSPASLAHSLVNAVPLENEYVQLPAGDRTPKHPDYPYLNVGWAVLALGLLGLVLVPLARPMRRHALVLLLFSLICFGVHAPVDLFRPLSFLPVVNSMRRPIQYFNFFIYAELVLLAGFGLWWLQRRLRDRRLQAALGVVAALALLPTAVENAARYRQAFRLELPPVTPAKEFYQVKLKNAYLREQIAKGYGDTYLNVLRRVGSVLWDSNIKLPENARPRYVVDDDGVLSVAGGYRGEAYFEDRRNRVTRVSITPNVITAEVDVRVPGTLVINQNHDPAWSASHGEVVPRQGLLRIDLKPGKRAVRLVYRPWPFYLGLVITLLTAAGAGVLVYRRRKARKEG